MRIGNCTGYTFGSKIDVANSSTRRAFREILRGNPNIHPNRVENLIMHRTMDDGHDHIIRYVSTSDGRYLLKITEVKSDGTKGVSTFTNSIPFVNPEDCFVHAFSEHGTQYYIDQAKRRLCAIA
ncbi:MAG: hypothetical protein PHX18_03855 [Candidatus Gastranaerophilales bacterium]|nr:hypothetical protein [Candidatus Gastranaerophilales bacterium]